MTPSVAGARPLDTADRAVTWVLPTERGAVRLTEAAVRLLRDVEAGRTWDEIARASTRSDGAAVTGEQVEAAHRALVAKLADAEDRPPATPGGMWAKVPVLPSRWVAPIARQLSVLFHPVAVALGVVLMAVGAVVAVPAVVATPPPSGAFWPAYGLFLAALAAHELGHASATARYGARPGEIGFVMYLIFPAFYSNVTSAWTLRRWQRVVVDVGGVYFELLFASALAIVYWFHPSDALRLMFGMVLASVTYTLNPIFKFDGYWVVADSLGVTELARQPVRLLHAAWEWSRGRAAPLPWPARTTAAVGVYSVLSLAVFGWFYAHLVPWSVQAAQRVPGLIRDVVADLAALTWPDQLGQLVMTSFVLLFASMTVWRLVRGAARFVGRRLGFGA